MFSKSKINEPGPKQGGADGDASGTGAASSDTTTSGDSMNKPSPQTGKTKPNPSILSSDLTVTGNLRTTGDIQVEGTVKGDIRAHLLTVGESATIEGEIIADDIVITGRVIGKVRGLKVRLTSTARGAAPRASSVTCRPPASARSRRPARARPAAPRSRWSSRPRPLLDPPVMLPRAATCGRMGDHQHLRPARQPASRRPTASAVAPPTPRSISSKIIVIPRRLGQADLERQQEPAELAARGDLVQRPRRRAGIGGHGEGHRVAPLGAGLGGAISV
jgi:hypothetical protein